jgi:hypothetical protein
VLAEGTQTYTLKSENRLNINGHRYNESQLAYIKAELAEMLYRFEYTNFKDTPTSFFNFDDHSQYSHIYGDYRNTNEANLTAKPSGKPFRHNTGGLAAPLPVEAYARVQDPAIDYHSKAVKAQIEKLLLCECVDGHERTA